MVSSSGVRPPQSVFIPDGVRLNSQILLAGSRPGVHVELIVGQYSSESCTLSENLDAVVALRTRSMTKSTLLASGDIHANTSVMSAEGSADAAVRLRDRQPRLVA